MLSSKNLPIMPALCSKLAYYADIMLDALACLLCLKLCRHNRRMPTLNLSIHAYMLNLSFVYNLVPMPT